MPSDVLFGDVEQEGLFRIAGRVQLVGLVREQVKQLFCQLAFGGAATRASAFLEADTRVEGLEGRVMPTEPLKGDPPPEVTFWPVRLEFDDVVGILERGLDVSQLEMSD